MAEAIEFLELVCPPPILYSPDDLIRPNDLLRRFHRHELLNEFKSEMRRRQEQGPKPNG